MDAASTMETLTQKRAPFLANAYPVLEDTHVPIELFDVVSSKHSPAHNQKMETSTPSRPVFGALAAIVATARPFLRTYLFGGWGQVNVHVLLFMCFWKIIHHDHDDSSGHCRYILTFVFFAILFFWSNTIWGMQASFLSTSFDYNTLAVLDTGRVLLDAASTTYGEVHERALMACDDLDTLARERREGLADSTTDACWYVLIEGACDADLWAASRGLAWFSMVWVALTVLCLCSCVGYSCAYPKRVGEALDC